MVGMRINKINFPIYGIIVLTSIFIGMLYIYINLRKEKTSHLLLFFSFYLIFSFVCGKLFTIVASSFKYSFQDTTLSSYGGFIGVILAAIVYEIIYPSNKKVIKYATISLPLVYGLSKIACFVSGCCYGLPYYSSFSVIYTDGLNIPLFPVQILETIVFIGIFIWCHRNRENRYIVYTTIIISALFKFSLDFFRYEHLSKVITINQWFSIGLIIVVRTILSIKYYMDNKSK